MIGMVVDGGGLACPHIAGSIMGLHTLTMNWFWSHMFPSFDISVIPFHVHLAFSCRVNVICYFICWLYCMCRVVGPFLILCNRVSV